MTEELLDEAWLREEPQEMLNRAANFLTSAELLDVRRARKLCEYVLTLDRDNPGILFMVASTYMREGRYALAECWFRYALVHDPKMAPIWCNLGYCYQGEGRNEEAFKCFEKAVELDPSEASYLNNLATNYVNNGTPDDAIERCNKALKLDPANSDALWNRSLAYLEKGMWVEGWEGYKAGLKGSEETQSSQKRKVRFYPEHKDLPYWDGTGGQSVVVYGEQGVGDELLASSMLEDAANVTNLVYEAHPRLVNIMRHNFGNRFPVYGTRKISTDQVCWPMWQRIDAKIPILGLGEHFRKKDEDFPRKVYLKPFDSLVDKYKEKLAAMGDRPKIGFSWKGGGVVTRHDLRSIGLGDWTDLIKDFDADWISLQYDGADRQGWNTPIVAEFEKETGLCINHWPEVVNDLDECYAGLINALDLVISVNTSVVHACGAFGVPTWVLTPSRPAWRYNIEGEHMIWYSDHMRQIRQVDDDWDGVFKTVRERLNSWMQERTAA
jgi:tetratricopeptide (TPR) repeat protein